VDILKKAWKSRFLKRFLKVFVPGRMVSYDKRSTDGVLNLLISLLRTSIYFFKSSTSAGSFELKMVKGETGAPSSM
jgi:hypothetical protein